MDAWSLGGTTNERPACRWTARRRAARRGHLRAAAARPAPPAPEAPADLAAFIRLDGKRIGVVGGYSAGSAR